MAQRATCLDSPPRLPETERVTEMIELDPTKCFPGKWRAIQISNVSLFIDPIFRGENLVEFKPPLSEDCRIRRVRAARFVELAEFTSKWLWLAVARSMFLYIPCLCVSKE